MGENDIKHPIISIIVPVYNVKPYLRKCIQSILNQTFKDFELLLINDGSTDGSGNLCDKLALKDERIRVFHQKNRGLSGARNSGLENAKGRWIGFVDSDDWIEENMYEVLLEKAVKHEADIVSCGYHIVYNSIQTNQTNIPKDKTITMNSQEAIVATFYKNSLSFSSCSKLFCHKIIKNNGLRYDETVLFAEDLCFLYQVLRVSKRVVKMDDKLYNYFINTNSMVSENSPKKRLTGIKVYKNILEQEKQDIVLKLVKEHLLSYRISMAISCQFKTRKRGKKYRKYLRRVVIGRLFKILFSSTLSVKQKISILSILNPKLFFLLLDIKKRLKVR